MAIETFYSTEYTAAHVTVPSEKLDVTLQHGRVRRAYSVYTLPAATEFDTIGDTVYFMKLPKGARVVNARFIATDDATSGICKIGWEDNGDDAADDNGLFAVAETDFGNADIDAKLLGTATGYNKKFAEETTIVMVITEVSNASTGNSFKLEVEYVLD